MNKKRNLILTILIAALVVGLLVWRLWPQTLENISGLDFDQAISLSAITRAWEYHNAEGEPLDPVFVSFKLEAKSPVSSDEHFVPVLEQFKDIKALPSLSNLLRPWPLSGFSWNGNVRFLEGFVSCGDTAANFTLTDRGELTCGQHLYFITDEEQFNALWDYVTTHGTENKS